MSNLLHDLEVVRDSWYDAFYSRNLDLLGYLETDWFVATNGKKFIYKKHQLHKLGLDDINHQDYQTGKRRESEIQIRQFENIAVVSGKADILYPQVDKKSIDFIECWIMTTSGWKLQFVSFDTP